jgi:hypothetical protein
VLEWALAARWWRFQSYEDFAARPGHEQSFLVAVYRTEQQIQAVIADHQAREAESRARNN